MKLLAGLLIFVSSMAFGYQEKIEVTNTEMRGSWVSDSAPAVAASGPIRGYFYVSTENFITPNCNDFSTKVRALIHDWNKYGNINMYALTLCTTVNGQLTTTFFYGIDLWRQDGVTAHQQFLKDHQGMVFEGHTLDFSPVSSLVARSDLTFGKKAGKGWNPVHSASRSQPYQYEDLWYPDYLADANVITQDNKATFLSYVEAKFGAVEKAAFESALSSSDFVNFGDFFTLTLANGKTADMWFGFGANKDCGGSACYASPSR